MLGSHFRTVENGSAPAVVCRRIPCRHSGLEPVDGPEIRLMQYPDWIGARNRRASHKFPRVAALLEKMRLRKTSAATPSFIGRMRNQKTALSRDVHPHGLIRIIRAENSTDRTCKIARHSLVFQQERACKSKFTRTRAHVLSVQTHQDRHVIHPLARKRKAPTLDTSTFNFSPGSNQTSFTFAAESVSR